MLDITQLRRDLNAVVAKLETRKNPQPFLDVARFSALEAERKTLQTRTEELQAQRNALSKQIGMLKGKAAKGEDTAVQVEALMAQDVSLKPEHVAQDLTALGVLGGHRRVLAGAGPVGANSSGVFTVASVRARSSSTAAAALAALFTRAVTVAQADLKRAVGLLMGSSPDVWVQAVRQATAMAIEERSGSWGDPLSPFFRFGEHNFRYHLADRNLPRE